MSLPADVKKQYGLVMAMGTKLGERAKDEPTLLDEIRKTTSAETFRDLVRAKAEGRAPAVLIEQFATLVTGADWLVWRSRLILQAKMTRDGGKPAAGHEAGKGVGKP